VLSHSRELVGAYVQADAEGPVSDRRIFEEQVPDAQQTRDVDNLVE
jgi:hypothetical protein